MNQAAAPEPGARARRGDFGVCNCKASDTIMIAQPASERPLTSNALAVTAARTASTTNASGDPEDRADRDVERARQDHAPVHGEVEEHARARVRAEQRPLARAQRSSTIWMALRSR